MSKNVLRRYQYAICRKNPITHGNYLSYIYYNYPTLCNSNNIVASSLITLLSSFILCKACFCTVYFIINFRSLTLNLIVSKLCFDEVICEQMATIIK